MLYIGIIAVSSQIHTKLINTLFGQNVEFLNVKIRGVKAVYQIGCWVSKFFENDNITLV
jgi:hypothetical protein